MPVETLPCGHPEWLSSSPPVVFHANRMYAFWTKHKRFPMWNAYSVAMTAAALLIVRVLSYFSQLAADIALCVFVFSGFLFVLVDWLRSRSSAVVED